MNHTTNHVKGALLVAVCLIPCYANAQGQVVIDWQTQKLVSYPQIVSQRMSTTVVVNNVNDLLYQYRIELTPTPRTVDDGASLLALADAAKGANQGMKLVNDDCTASVSKLNSMITTIGQATAEIFDANRKTTDGKYRTLQQVISEWNDRVKSVMKDLPWSMQNVTLACTDPALLKNIGEPALARATTVQIDNERKQRAIDGPHQIRQATTLNPETDYQVTVTELLPSGTPTGTPFSATFSPTSHQLTLSLGTLLSEIQQRAYTSSKDPTNTSQNLLSVNGSGRFSPLGVALLNYEIPKLSNEVIGATVSSGLVLRFGSNAVSASSLGWFGGGGVHIYHRFFVSAGIHVGQFSDFPVGLQRGSVIPANYGDLNGPNSSTTRFAFAVTYQTKKFSTGSTTTKTQTPAGGQTTPAGGAKTNAPVGNN